MSNKIDSYPIISKKLPEKGIDSVIEALDEFSIRLECSSEEYVVIGGANMVLRGIKRATTDIDILVSDDLFDAMKSTGDAKIKYPPRRALENGATNLSILLDAAWSPLPISAAKEMGDGYFPISYQGYESMDLEQIMGHKCTPLEHIWGSKIALQRPKDISDLKAIAKILGKSTNFPSPKHKGPYLDS